jgi:hypothetical protein
MCFFFCFHFLNCSGSLANTLCAVDVNPIENPGGIAIVSYLPGKTNLHKCYKNRI